MKRAEAQQTSSALVASLGIGFDRAPIALLAVDSEGRVVATNEAARRALESDAGLLPGVAPGEIVRCINHREDPEGCGSGSLCGCCSVRQAVRDTIETGASRGPFEVAFPSDDADARLLRIATSAIQIDRRGLALVSVEDVGEKEHTLGQLARDVVDNVPSGVLIYEYRAPDSLRLRGGNRAAERLTGVDPSALAGREFDEIWPEARAGGLTEALLEVMRTGKPYETDAFDYADSRLAGSFLIRAFRLPSDRLAVAFENRTAQRETSKALAESAAMLRALVESTDSMIVFLDTAQRVCLFNAAYAEHMRVAHGVEVLPGLPVQECYEGEELRFWTRSNARALAGEHVREAHVEQVGDQMRTMGTGIHPILREGRVIGVSHFTRDITDSLRAADRLQELTRRLVVVQEEERRRLSRELHDEIGQVLTAVKMSLQRLQRSEQRGALWDRLEENVGHVNRAIGDIRRLCLALRPPLLDEVGLASALRDLAGRVARDGGLEIQVDVDGLPPRLPTGLEVAVFRVAQEALTNVLRHAHARHAWLSAGINDRGVDLAIRDDGRGFDARGSGSRSVGLGLGNMRERAELLGGGLNVESRPGAGTEVTVWLPLSERGGGTT